MLFKRLFVFLKKRQVINKEKMSEKYISDMGLTSRIYKELLNSIIRQITFLKRQKS